MNDIINFFLRFSKNIYNKFIFNSILTQLYATGYACSKDLQIKTIDENTFDNIIKKSKITLRSKKIQYIKYKEKEFANDFSFINEANFFHTAMITNFDTAQFDINDISLSYSINTK